MRRLNGIPVGLRVTPRGEARACRLEPRHCLEHFDERGKAQLYHLCALARAVLNHAPRFELAQGLADWSARGLETSSQCLLIKPGARPQFSCNDVSLKCCGELVSETGWPLEACNGSFGGCALSLAGLNRAFGKAKRIFGDRCFGDRRRARGARQDSCRLSHAANPTL